MKDCGLLKQSLGMNIEVPKWESSQYISQIVFKIYFYSLANLIVTQQTKPMKRRLHLPINTKVEVSVTL